MKNPILRILFVLLLLLSIHTGLQSNGCSCCPSGYIPAPVSFWIGSPGAPRIAECGNDMNPVGYCCLPFGGDK